MLIVERRTHWKQKGGMNGMACILHNRTVHNLLPEARGHPRRLQFLSTKNAQPSTIEMPKSKDPKLKDTEEIGMKGLSGNEVTKAWYVPVMFYCTRSNTCTRANNFAFE
jgi:hypothetical protein